MLFLSNARRTSPATYQKFFLSFFRLSVNLYNPKIKLTQNMVATMSLTAQYVPTTNPTIPQRMSIISLIKMYLQVPSWSGQYTQSSMIAGKAIPRAERHKAPKREMKSSRFGMATANRTEKC